MRRGEEVDHDAGGHGHLVVGVAGKRKGTVGQGGDQPSNVVQLTAESLRMQFLSNNASTSQNSVGQALETLGRKQ